MNKYNAKKTKVGNIHFDSKKEANRYRELKLLESFGAIKDLELQKKFLLIPAQRDENNKLIEREVAYYADFVYLEKIDNGKEKPFWRMVCEDTKGVRTPLYKVKRKLMLYVHHIRIQEI